MAQGIVEESDTLVDIPLVLSIEFCAYDLAGALPCVFRHVCKMVKLALFAFMNVSSNNQDVCII